MFKIGVYLRDMSPLEFASTHNFSSGCGCDGCGLGPLSTRVSRPLSHKINIICLVKKQETAQGHFTLDLGGMRDQREFGWMGNLYDVLHGISYTTYLL